MKNTRNLSVALFGFLMLADNKVDAACPEPCGCNPAPVVTAHTPPTADPYPTIEICKSCSGDDCISWPGDADGDGDSGDADDFVAALGINLQNVSDTDRITYKTWSQNEFCNCSIVSDGPYDKGDSVEVTWSGSVDRCTPGSYTLTATLTNPTLQTQPQGGCCDAPPGNPQCDTQVPTSVQETGTVTVTVIVKDLLPTYDPPLCGGINLLELGRKSDVSIFQGGVNLSSSGICVRKDTPVTLTGNGGDDNEVCVKSNPGGCDIINVVPVGSDLVWTGSGTVSPTNERSFTVDTSTPGEKIITFTSNEGSGDCNVGSEIKTVSITVTVYEVYGVFGSTNVTRGSNGNYSVLALGLTPKKYDWRSNWFNPSPSGSSTWDGKIVANTTVNCDVVFECPHTGVQFSIAAAPYSTICDDRGWTTPVSFASDNEAGFNGLGNFPPTVLNGVNRDRITNQGWYWYPNPYSGSWKDGYVTTLVADQGPNDCLWYIESTTLKLDRESVISNHLKSNGPVPAGAPHNWHAENNLTCFATHNGKSVDTFRQAVIDHEGYGNHAKPGGEPSGHQGMIETRNAITAQWDVRHRIENNVSSSIQQLEALTNSEIDHLQTQDMGDGAHAFVTNNWVTAGGTLPWRASFWDGTLYPAACPSIFATGP